MSSSIKLEHIGEDLVSSMLRVSDSVQRHVLGRSLTDKSEIVCELPLDNWCDRIFDGAHRIDVAVIEGEACFPIELKLGLSRMGATTFSSRFLTSVSTSHHDTRIKGGMISILDRRWEGRENDVIEVKATPEKIQLVRPWTLVVRKEVAQNWSNTSTPNLSRYCRVVVLEDLVSMFGSPNDFNYLVGKLVAGDYYNKWFVA